MFALIKTIASVLVQTLLLKTSISLALIKEEKNSFMAGANIFRK
jgi:hypothetical protein